MTLGQRKDVCVNVDIGHDAVKLVAQPHIVDGIIDIESIRQSGINVVEMTIEREATPAISRR